MLDKRYWFRVLSFGIFESINAANYAAQIAQRVYMRNQNPENLQLRAILQYHHLQEALM